LQIWTHDATLAASTYVILSVLVVGMALNAIMHGPYALQLAYGWTSLALYQNFLALICLVPIMIWSVERFGAVAAACAWLALNVPYVTVGIQIMHGRLLPGQKWRWYRKDVGLPAMAALPVVALARWWLPQDAAPPIQTLSLITVLVVAWVAALDVTPL